MASPPAHGTAGPAGPARHVDTQVIVVGAGPAGLFLAGELALRGIQVTLVEQRHRPSTASRATTLHARTMEILDSRGLLTGLTGAPNEPRGHFGGIPMDLTLPTPWPGQFKVPQARTEAVLEEWALGLGADLRCGHTLHTVTARPTHVEATATGRDGTPLTLRAAYLVACDGQDSTVRRLTGAAFPGTPATRELLRADVNGIDIPERRFQRLPAGFAVAARNRAGTTRVMVHAFGTPARDRIPGSAPHFEEITDAWKRVTGEDISTGTPLWVNHFDDAARQLAHYRHGRVLFAGDAAHRQMPIGGQSLNLALQDAHNLGFKLAATLDRTAPDTLLDTYHSERHPVGAAALAHIRAQAHLLLAGPDIEGLRTVFTELLTHDSVRTRLAEAVSGLGVRYDTGGPAHPLSGRRVPHVALRVGAIRCCPAELLRSGRGLLLGVGSEPPPLDPRLADRIDTVTAGAAPRTPLAATPALLIRPDGHIVWTGGPDGDRLDQATRRWFGTP
ncbi:FAD-dependent oxidoreductase [Streptomyces sp. NPDC088387]|uniref:FAD-dependent oxidoreductase n=1 Tax=Streptomyces sp. NPDC088387 TaxID=3365859 RepID=UPI00382ED05B